MKRKEISATEFKAGCLQILDELDSEGIVITKRGKPVAELRQSGRLEIDLESLAFRRCLQNLTLFPIRYGIALESTRLDFASDPADEIIAATSIVENMPPFDPGCCHSELKSSSIS